MVQSKPVSPASTTFTRDRGSLGASSAKPRFTAEKIPLSPEMAIVESSLNDLSGLLREAIAKKIYVGESIENCLTLKQAIDVYDEQNKSNSQLQREWNRYLKQLVVFKGQKSGDDEHETLDEKLQEAIEAWRSEILNTEGLKHPTNNNVVTAKLAALPIKDVKILLARDVEDAIKNLTFTILKQLATMVELEVLSLIEWFSDDTCSYKRFVRGLKVQNGVRGYRQTSVDVLEGRWERRKGIVNQHGSTKRTLSCHIQHLVKAESHRIGDSKVLIPRDQKAFIASLPDWLSPSVRIVEGTLIRETLVEQDVGVYEWERKVGEWETREDMSRWFDDPAIVLGPFVLSAWGPKEIQAELAEQAAEAKILAYHDSRKMAPIRIIGLVEVMLAAFFCMGWRASIVNLVIGLIAALMAYVTLGNRWDSFSLDNASKNIDDDSTPEDAFGYAGMLIGAAVFSSFLLSIGLIVGGIASALIAFLILRLYTNATFLWNPVVESEKRND